MKKISKENTTMLNNMAYRVTFSQRSLFCLHFCLDWERFQKFFVEMKPSYLHSIELWIMLLFLAHVSIHQLN